MDIKSKIKQFEILRYLHNLITQPYNKYFISDKKHIIKLFNKRLGRDVNLKNPKNLMINFNG